MSITSSLLVKMELYGCGIATMSYCYIIHLDDVTMGYNDVILLDDVTMGYKDVIHLDVTLANSDHVTIIHQSATTISKLIKRHKSRSHILYIIDSLYLKKLILD